ncbi:MAG: penicillin-binding protein 2 [Lachnospiraceae bacterium]|nr:penicillin-binding protein 2 [Lachnospiraceae bacterium]
MQNKLAFLFTGAMLAFLFLAVVVVITTTQNYDEYAVKVFSNYNYSSTSLTAARGTITDRNGNSLAISEPEYLLIIEAQNINDDKYYQATIAALTKVFGLDRAELESFVVNHPNSQYYRYRESDGQTLMIVPLDKIEEFEAIESAVNVTSARRKLEALSELFGLTTDEVAARFPEYARFAVEGVWFEKRYERVYPYGSLACKVIGYQSGDSAEYSTGIEKYYDLQLTGVDGKSYGYLNDDYNLNNQVVAPVEGNTVVSTIDVQIQSIVEEKIADYMENTGAENVGVVVMNPNNGEIYAMATDTYFDLNDPTAKPDSYTQSEWDSLSAQDKSTALNELYSNYCVSSSFEPGSVFKAFVVAMAYEEGYLNGDENFYCGGYRVVNGWKVRCHNRDGCGVLDIFGALQNSCNVCLMQIADMVGKEDFTTYFNRFGFGKKTGIDLPGEMDTSALVYSDFTTQPDVTLACASFGQGFNVTMVEVCAAFASLVNGGYYYTPHVVKEIQSVDGTIVYTADTTPQYLTISQETCEYMREALFAVVEGGTAQTIKVPGYNIGGKTGSAEMVINGKRAEDEWVCSIVTACPIEDPEVLIYTLIDRGKDPENYSNSMPAQLLSKAIYEEVLPYLNIHSNLDEYDYIVIPETEAPVESSYEEAAITAEVGEVETDPQTGLIIETEPVETDENGEPVSVENPADESSEGESTEPSPEGGESISPEVPEETPAALE